MFKYKMEINRLASEGTNALDVAKKQMLFGMLALLAQAFKAMPEVKSTTVQEDNSIIIEATEDIDLKFRALGNQIKVSKLS